MLSWRMSGAPRRRLGLGRATGDSRVQGGDPDGGHDQRACAVSGLAEPDDQILCAAAHPSHPKLPGEFGAEARDRHDDAERDKHDPGEGDEDAGFSWSRASQRGGATARRTDADLVRAAAHPRPCRRVSGKCPCRRVAGYIGRRPVHRPHAACRLGEAWRYTRRRGPLRRRQAAYSVCSTMRARPTDFPGSPDWHRPRAPAAEQRRKQGLSVPAALPAARLERIVAAAQAAVGGGESVSTAAGGCASVAQVTGDLPE